MEISIIIPTHNCGLYIERAIRSALDQTFHKGPYEIIVVDDGSTDDTGNILKAFKDRINVIKLKQNRGLSHARNYGIKKALGKFILCLDADDYISNDILHIEHLLLYHNRDIDAVSCDYLVVNDGEDIIEKRSAVERPIACGIMFYKDKLKEIGLYDKTFMALEDLDLRKRYLEKFSIYNMPLPLYRYRDRRGSLSKNKKCLDYYHKKLCTKHKIEDIHAHLRNHRNLKGALTKCCS